MFALSVLEAPNTKTNSLCVQTHLALKLFQILLILLMKNDWTFLVLYMEFVSEEIGRLLCPNIPPIWGKNMSKYPTTNTA